MILRIALDTPLRRLFDYLPPADAAHTGLGPGVRVRVPFGRRRVVGVLVEVAAQASVAAEKLRRALEVLDREPVIDRELLAFVRWAADYYHHPPGEVLAAVLPAPLRAGQAAQALQERWRITPLGRESALATLGKRGPRQRALIECLLACDSAGADELAALGTAWRDHARAGMARGWVEAFEQPLERSAVSTSYEVRPGPELTAAQKVVVDDLTTRLDKFGVSLLYGVTGSGKTEVYLRIVERIVAAGRQALVLVPEIALTPQLVGRFQARFAAPIVVLHSALGGAERLNAWRRARSGEAAIVIGTRSAVFSPLERPGVIVVDEEHDGSYKQQEGFRYSARDLAVTRAQRLGIPVILGSATPSLESLENARQGRYTRLELPERPGAARHPHVRLIDLRVHASAGGLATPTADAISRHLDAGGQVLVYINRRGYAPTLFCPACGWVAPCRNCDARLTVHLRTQTLRCHHCGAREAMPLACPTCGHEVKPVGLGTERIEDTLRDRFPKVAMARLDRDSVRRRGDMEAILDRVAAGEARILVGTQMLTKGHDFPDVTLVVIVHADQGLFSADFRASERLAQTIVQVSGRAGRASRPGEVLIQTEFPEHPLLVSLLSAGYGGFAATALAERKAAHWPPFSRLALLRADAPEGSAAFEFLEAALARAEPVPSGVRLLGPVTASLARRAGRHHAQLLAESASRTTLQRFLDRWVKALEGIPAVRRVHWSLDVDPLDLM